MDRARPEDAYFNILKSCGLYVPKSDTGRDFNSRAVRIKKDDQMRTTVTPKRNMNYVRMISRRTSGCSMVKEGRRNKLVELLDTHQSNRSMVMIYIFGSVLPPLVLIIC